MSKHTLYNTTGLQKNNKSHVLYALADKQMELKQLQKEYSKKISKIKLDLLSLKSTICLFDDDCEETISKINNKTSHSGVKKRNSYFERSEVRKLILTALRTADSPLQTSEVSLLCQSAKNLASDDIVTNKAIQKIVVLTLRELEKKNLVKAVGKDGLAILWKIRD
ncbi:hypothetical protein [Sulfurimonas sp.]|uniref:hypothetical protein n=1 Tax=Sulfurimonas sp. TaxID=2022749 RepID=UPI002AB0062B|nr:hypothetical protein [Sulfurimonas sp.]